MKTTPLRELAQRFAAQVPLGHPLTADAAQALRRRAAAAVGDNDPELYEADAAASAVRHSHNTRRLANAAARARRRGAAHNLVVAQTLPITAYFDRNVRR